VTVGCRGRGCIASCRCLVGAVGGAPVGLRVAGALAGEVAGLVVVVGVAQVGFAAGQVVREAAELALGGVAVAGGGAVAAGDEAAPGEVIPGVAGQQGGAGVFDVDRAVECVVAGGGGVAVRPLGRRAVVGKVVLVVEASAAGGRSTR
jgi:hypothetical protein